MHSQALTRAWPYHGLVFVTKHSEAFLRLVEAEANSTTHLSSLTAILTAIFTSSVQKDNAIIMIYMTVSFLTS